MSRIILFLLFVFIWFAGMANQESDSNQAHNPYTENELLLIDHFDSLTTLLFSGEIKMDNSWIDKDADPGKIPVFPDSVYVYRLASIPTPIEMEYNEDVRKYIDLYVIHRRPQMQRMLGLSQLYFPVFEEVLDRYNLPQELKYLPVIESAMNPNAVSHMGATGLWQFMHRTARIYDMQINSYIDERRDPLIATDAAARYLRDLYDIYGDWTLALAAYNCGPGNLNRAIRRSGGKTNYWEIREFLPKETQNYIPAFIGASYAMEYYKEHLIVPVMPEQFFEPMDTVIVRGRIHLKEIAEAIEIPLEVLAFLNPSLRNKVIPYMSEGYALRLPVSKTGIYLAMEGDLLKPKAPASPVTREPVYPTAHEFRNAHNTNSGRRTYYTVQNGDNLSAIARRHGCTVADIQRWNNLNTTRIITGQRLVLYKAGSDMANTSDQENFRNYIIQQGDTLWDISQRFPNNSVEELRRINNLNYQATLRPGQIIQIVQ